MSFLSVFLHNALIEKKLSFSFSEVQDLGEK